MKRERIIAAIVAIMLVTGSRDDRSAYCRAEYNRGDSHHTGCDRGD